MVELGQVEALEGSDAMHDAVFGNEENTGDSCGILGFVGGNWHDEGARFTRGGALIIRA